MGADRQEPVAVTDREELIYLLSEASELEHGLCCCYLFAAFSLKRNLDEDLTPSEHDAVVRWERVISGVAWTVFAERLSEITSRSDQLGLDAVHTTLESLLSRFTDAQGRRVRSHPPSAIP